MVNRVDFIIGARDRTRAIIRRIARSLRELGRIALNVGRRIALVGTVGFSALARGAVLAGQSLVDVSNQLSISTDLLQAFQNAARVAGVRSESVNEFLQRFTTNLGKAQEGNEAFIKAFRDAGITGRELLGSPIEVLDLLLKNVKDLSQASRQAVVNPIGDVAGVRVINALLGEQLDTVEKIQARGRQFGIIPEETLKRLDDAGDKFFQAFQQIKPTVFELVADALEAITPKLPGLADALVGFSLAVGRLLRQGGQTLGFLQSLLPESTVVGRSGTQREQEFRALALRNNQDLEAVSTPQGIRIMQKIERNTRDSGGFTD